MLTTEIKINGQLVVVVYVHNEFKFDIDDRDDDHYVYHYEIYEVGQGDMDSGEVIYSRKDGLCKLVSKILEKYVP